MHPTLYFIPCFSGSPWDLDRLGPLHNFELRTARLPENLDSIPAYAQAVAMETKHIDDLVLVGDSFGALVGLYVAARGPDNLRAMILSGGFAANPIKSPPLRLLTKILPLLRGPLYRHGVLRYHARNLSSPYDACGEIPWDRSRTRELFLSNTTHRSFVARTHAAMSTDLRPMLSSIRVPTLIISPSNDRLIGKHATQEMLQGIPDATEVILDQTGHMFRFSHPRRYAEEIKQFLDRSILTSVQAAT